MFRTTRKGNEQIDIGAAVIPGTLGERTAGVHANQKCVRPFPDHRLNRRLHPTHRREDPGVDGLAVQNLLQVSIGTHGRRSGGRDTPRL